MAATNSAATASFDDFIKAGRQKKKNEQLAQEILGKRRSSTPAGIKQQSNLGGSLASRVGVTKRPSSLSRSQSSQNRVQQTRVERNAPTLARQQSQPGAPARSHRKEQPKQAPRNAATQSNGNGLSIKGAAGGPYIVTASNFARGTSAADIQSVMENVGGEVIYCKIVAASPTVIAEMAFRERSGADTVISTFNNKKADGRLLKVHMKDEEGAELGGDQDMQSTPAGPEYADEAGDDAMEVDENARSREAENKLREERRGGNNNASNNNSNNNNNSSSSSGGGRGRQDVFPSGPRNMRAFGQQEDNYYYSDTRGSTQQQQQSGYQDGRYAFGNGGGGYGRVGGRYHDDHRGYGGRNNGQWRN